MLHCPIPNHPVSIILFGAVSWSKPSSEVEKNHIEIAQSLMKEQPKLVNEIRTYMKKLRK